MSGSLDRLDTWPRFALGGAVVAVVGFLALGYESVTARLVSACCFFVIFTALLAYRAQRRRVHGFIGRNAESDG